MQSCAPKCEFEPVAIGDAPGFSATPKILIQLHAVRADNHAGSHRELVILEINFAYDEQLVVWLDRPAQVLIVLAPTELQQVEFVKFILPGGLSDSCKVALRQLFFLELIEVEIGNRVAFFGFDLEFVVLHFLGDRSFECVLPRRDKAS